MWRREGGFLRTIQALVLDERLGDRFFSARLLASKHRSGKSPIILDIRPPAGTRYCKKR